MAVDHSEWKKDKIPAHEMIYEKKCYKILQYNVLGN